MAGKKRKVTGRQPSAKKNDVALQSKFNANETFDDSEDEFVAGRDHILLEEGPEAKRRRKIQEEGVLICDLSPRTLSYNLVYRSLLSTFR
jgi:U3 small nucleolar RNA-associated protein 3